MLERYGIRGEAGRPHSWAEARDAILVGINIVLLLRWPVFTFNINLLGVGFRITLSRAYSFVGVGFVGAVLGVSHYGGGNFRAADSFDL